MALPAFGWNTHSEQVDAASLAARAWSMRTTTPFGGLVITTLLGPPAPAEIMRLEKIWEHKHSCKNPSCTLGDSDGLCIDLLMDASGRFNPGVILFVTAVLVGPILVPELKTFATVPTKAAQNHHDAVTMLIGMLSAWRLPNRERV